MKNSVRDAVISELYVGAEYLDANDALINLKNGIYNLETQELLPHDPAQYLTTQLPFAYEPDATAPTWELYYKTTFVKPRSKEFDPELAEFVQEAMGYSLTTSIRYQCAFWCYGEGANGKSILFHVLKQLGGDACTPLNIGLLKREPYQLATLAGKRIALCSEASATNNLVDDAHVKALISGDLLSARQIYGKNFILGSKAKLWWAFNEKPPTADTSEGFWRRIRIVPFNRQFAPNERIADLDKLLDQELPGIFNWAMTGLRRLHDRGRFILPSQVVDATEQYRHEANPVALFVEECCFINAPVDQQALASTLYGAYNDWCRENNYKPHSSKNFSHELERLGHWRVRRAGGTFYGLGLKLATF